MARPSLPHRARTLAGLLLLGAAATTAMPPVARAQQAMVQWQQQIQTGIGNGSIPSPASYGLQNPAAAAAGPASPPTAAGGTPIPPTPSPAALATPAAPAPPAGDTTCPPLRVSQMARIQAGRPVRVRGGNCVMDFN